MRPLQGGANGTCPRACSRDRLRGPAGAPAPGACPARPPGRCPHGCPRPRQSSASPPLRSGHRLLPSASRRPALPLDARGRTRVRPPAGGAEARRPSPPKVGASVAGRRGPGSSGLQARGPRGGRLRDTLPGVRAAQGPRRRPVLTPSPEQPCLGAALLGPPRVPAARRRLGGAGLREGAPPSAALRGAGRLGREPPVGRRPSA